MKRSAIKGCKYDHCAVPESRHDVCAAWNITPCYGALQHQHVPKRSQGGKRAIVMLCAGHHDCIDNGGRYEGLRLGNEITTLASGQVIYRIYDREDRGVSLKWFELEHTEKETT